MLSLFLHCLSLEQLHTSIIIYIDVYTLIYNNYSYIIQIMHICVLTIFFRGGNSTKGCTPPTYHFKIIVYKLVLVNRTLINKEYSPSYFLNNSDILKKIY